MKKDKKEEPISPEIKKGRKERDRHLVIMEQLSHFDTIDEEEKTKVRNHLIECAFCRAEARSNHLSAVQK